MNNKLGIGYNCFGYSIELLEASVKSVRNVAEYIVVVYQDISNFKTNSPVKQKPILEKLKKAGLIDEYILYKPSSLFIKKSEIGSKNEIKKRNIALKASLKNGCSHFMSMDNDEFYIEKELLKAKDFMFKNPDYESSACKMQNYYKEPIYLINPSSEVFYVSLINKIDYKTSFNLQARYPAKYNKTAILF